jgi:predicted glycoside hydrolase/deacetylase ChbG (UPF0249 family)
MRAAWWLPTWVMSEMALRPLLICADDFGLSSGVDEAISALVVAGRLNAFSCMSGGPHWRRSAPRVAQLHLKAQAGLHFNLTEGAPLSATLRAVWPQYPGLGRLLLAAHLGSLPLHALADELQAQWAAFEDATGLAPDFLDGHQHVHHLPGVRPIVLHWAAQHRLPVRSTAQLAGPASGFKRRVIEHTGGRAMANGLAQHGLPHNRVLLGAYGFEPQADYRRLMQHWLAQVPEPDGALLFCHPGLPCGEDVHDPIAAARHREHAYLASDDFVQDLAQAGVGLAPIWPDRLGLNRTTSVG